MRISEIHRYISNRLDEKAIVGRTIAGIIGDSPSHYSKSPGLWNAAFRDLGMNAVYLPFDVTEGRLRELLRVLRDSEQFIGINVTVPHKVRVIDFLDDLDAGAARIHAVNTVIRNANGRLIGFNTDGAGFIDSLLLPSPDAPAGFMQSLAGIDALLLGAGGSARAVAFHLSEHLGKGKLIIANRTVAHAQSLANEINQRGHHALAIEEEGIANWAPKAGVIINSTTKGQGGLRKLHDGMATMLAPYSALAPADPPILAEDLGERFEAQWHEAARSDIQANNRRSEALAAAIPQATRFYDLIYHPEETVFLRHGRVSGHRAMNGKHMIVRQAVIAFCNHICQPQLVQLGKDDEAIRSQVTAVMYRAW